MFTYPGTAQFKFSVVPFSNRTATDSTEFDFKSDRYDIRIPSDIYEAINNKSPHPGVTSYIPESVYSLRAYCSILYLKPRMQVVIRGQKVKSQLIAKSLAYIQKDHYKPNFLNKRVPIIFGYNTKSKDQYGVMMYHKNRLIKPYERVGCQLKANNMGVGVIGVIECNFLDPTHNKQSFDQTDKYRKTINTLGIKLEEYWKEIHHKRKKEDPNCIPVEDTMKRPDQNWAQCDTCLKWRKLPDGIDCTKLPEKWYCALNPDPQFRSCQVEEEPEDSDDEQPSYRKTFKQQEREDKKIKERQRQKEEEERKRKEQRLAELTRQNQALKQQLRQAPTRSPSTPTTPTTPRRFNSHLPKGGAVRAESFTISQAACSPSSSSGLPVISNVCSLSAGIPRGKRTQPSTPQRTPKRPKVNGHLFGTPSTSISVDVSPMSSPLVPVDNDSDDTDDDILILETDSTPKPKKPGFDLTKVKSEKEQSEVGMLLECSDDAALDDPWETDAAGTGSAVSTAVGTSPPPPAPPAEVASITTQTDVAKVKKEEEDLDQTQEEERAAQSDTRNENQRKQTLQKEETDHLCRADDAGPSRADVSDRRDAPLLYPSVIEVQEQQNQLLDLMEATALERDEFKEQVRALTCQLQDAQSRLQELTEVNVKRECSHQASQTEETGGGKDYKSLFERAIQKVSELIKDKESLLATAETKPSAAQGEEKDIDEITLQVERLIRELDQRNKERDELHSRLDSMEGERANLASQCEALRLSLQQEREKAQEARRATDSSESGGTAPASGTESSSDTFRSLMELRHNIGRLLISYVPALDLDQVNYECNVIDEILEQVLSNEESFIPLGT
uniref:MORC family CW-type zinc finger 3a n=1 Tax=Sparus aurata TaxID=8175 RepID=A0A671W9Z5_SPAAU